MRRFPRPPPPRARSSLKILTVGTNLSFAAHTERNQHYRDPAPPRTRLAPAAFRPAGSQGGEGRATEGGCSLRMFWRDLSLTQFAVLLPLSLPQDRSESIASQGGSGGKPKGGAVVGKFRVADGAVKLLDSADVEQVKSAKVSEVSELLDISSVQAEAMLQARGQWENFMVSFQK